MIYEYALEPALLNNWEDFRYFTEKFGFFQGRFISRYPRRWKKMVIASLSETGPKRTKMVERIRKLDDRMLTRPHEWKPEKDWLTNAEAEHGRRLFRAILAKDNPRRHDDVLLGGDVEDDTPLFKIEGNITIPRSAREIATLVAPVLQHAEEILLIDSNFGPENPRHRHLMKKFLAAAISGRGTSPLKRVEIHLKEKAIKNKEQSAAFFRSQALEKLPRLIPECMNVRLVRWSDGDSNDRFHNRFILTDRGGLQFGDGLDDGGGKDQVSRFGKESETYRYLRKLYEKGSSTLDFIDEVEIVGTSTQRR